MMSNDEYTEVQWSLPTDVRGGNGTGSINGKDSRMRSILNKNAAIALRAAIGVARDFDSKFELRNPQRESSIPMFETQELVLGSVIRSYTGGFFTEIHLRGIQLASKLKHGAFGRVEQEHRHRFVERSIDGFYSVKFLQDGTYYNSVHATTAAAEMMMETKILMNLAPHPNISQLYGVTAAGSEAFLKSGKDGFFIIVDRLSETLSKRIHHWRSNNHSNGNADPGAEVMQRLEVALDISSALTFLNDRQIVYNLRPDKVGFDSRYGCVKLCDFGQARENGQQCDDVIDSSSDSLIKTDDIRTLAYTAPEVLCEAPVTLSSDVYAFGIVLWEILSLKVPFHNMNRGEHFEKVVINNYRPKINNSWPDELKSLISSCWDANFRPRMKKVCDTLENTLLFIEDTSVFHESAPSINLVDKDDDYDDEASFEIDDVDFNGNTSAPSISNQRQSSSSNKGPHSKRPSRSRPSTQQNRQGSRQRRPAPSHSKSSSPSGSATPSGSRQSLRKVSRQASPRPVPRAEEKNVNDANIPAPPPATSSAVLTNQISTAKNTSRRRGGRPRQVQETVDNNVDHRQQQANINTKAQLSRSSNNEYRQQQHKGNGISHAKIEQTRPASPHRSVPGRSVSNCTATKERNTHKMNNASNSEFFHHPNPNPAGNNSKRKAPVRSKSTNDSVKKSISKSLIEFLQTDEDSISSLEDGTVGRGGVFNKIATKKNNGGGIGVLAPNMKDVPKKSTATTTSTSITAGSNNNNNNNSNNVRNEAELSTTSFDPFQDSFNFGGGKDTIIAGVEFHQKPPSQLSHSATILTKPSTMSKRATSNPNEYYAEGSLVFETEARSKSINDIGF